MNAGERKAFFDDIYVGADGDATQVPWADRAAKTKLLGWLERNLGKGQRAIDVACGLGDNAEAIAAAGWNTTAFDYSEQAITWAKQRFLGSPVNYQVQDLLNLPTKFKGAFDLVNECYTLQALPPDTIAQTIPAIVSLIAPGGTLLVYSRLREDAQTVEGPPWPLECSKLGAFQDFGLIRLSRNAFHIEKDIRHIPIVFDVWKKPQLSP